MNQRSKFCVNESKIIRRFLSLGSEHGRRGAGILPVAMK
jgi:hypothetical protein